ncbi:hypothetical protein BDF14DRAFT_225523 [Spinellus fusiger]|nr:hypothetical protein BDF14DRAFT_225523 [Spinellus fusiger]
MKMPTRNWLQSVRKGEEKVKNENTRKRWGEVIKCEVQKEGMYAYIYIYMCVCVCSFQQIDSVSEYIEGEESLFTCGSIPFHGFVEG